MGHLGNHPSAKARTARSAREQDRGGGYGGTERRRAWRVGTRSGFGRPSGPGFFGGAAAVAVPNRARFSRALSRSGGVRRGRGGDGSESRSQ
ncbi:MAG TPA: hypothetical protein VFJ06_01585 [Halococcus sp.]|nr:hypothetical protein [Halococcus sp.]